MRRYHHQKNDLYICHESVSKKRHQSNRKQDTYHEVLQQHRRRGRKQTGRIATPRQPIITCHFGTRKTRDQLAGLGARQAVSPHSQPSSPFYWCPFKAPERYQEEMGILDALDQSFAASGTNFSFGGSSQQGSQQASGPTQSTIHEAFAAARAKKREDLEIDFGASRPKENALLDANSKQTRMAMATCR